MRLVMEQRLSECDDPILAKLVLGEATADQIVNSFFAMCAQAADLDEEEAEVSTRLKKEVKDETKRRNDFAHGDWGLGFGVPGDPILWRTKPGRKAGAWEQREFPGDEIDKLSEAIYLLRQMVAEVGDICLNPQKTEFIWKKPIRVRDVYRFDRRKHRVTRNGPRAGERNQQYS